MDVFVNYVVIVFLFIVVVGIIVIVVIVINLFKGDNNFVFCGVICWLKFDYKWKLYDNDIVGMVYEILFEFFCDLSCKIVGKRVSEVGEGIGDLNGIYFRLL